MQTDVFGREGRQPGDGGHSLLLHLWEHLEAGQQHGVHVGNSTAWWTEGVM